MITFYRSKECASCAAIEEALDQLVLAHRSVTLAPGERPGLPVPEEARLPVLVDEGKVVQGQAAILGHLEELEAFKREWEKFQTDACYCDEEGEVI